MIDRRSILKIGSAGLASLASGCGFHPLYAPGGAQTGTMQSVYVDLIANRPGQLLRQALQSRLEGTDGDAAKRYTLSVQYTEAEEFIGIQADNSSSRARSVGRATWTLFPVDNPSAPLTTGNARSVDGFNVIDEQYFYMDLSMEATERRLAEALADQIVIGLSVYFTKHPAKA